MRETFARGKFQPLSAHAGQYFGHDLQAALSDWWNGELQQYVRQHFGKTGQFDLAAVVMEWSPLYGWADPLNDVLHYLVLGDPESNRYAGPDGLFRNIAGKLRFTLRTGRDSSEANTYPWLVLPGDFPVAGAVISSGLVAAVSGLAAPDDARVATRLIDKLVGLREPLALDAMKASKDRKATSPPSVKYLGADPANHASVVASGFSFNLDA